MGKRPRTIPRCALCLTSRERILNQLAVSGPRGLVKLKYLQTQVRWAELADLATCNLWKFWPVASMASGDTAGIQPHVTAISTARCPGQNHCQFGQWLSSSSVASP